MKILLTNDDSHRSPLLEFIIKKLSRIGELTIVVPAEEQSWKGKSVSRLGELCTADIDLFGHPAVTLTGTPADCANFGIYHLFEEKPDLVVSGINIGHNTGVCFIASSGTVGACLEANIAGVPGIAFSQMLKSELFEAMQLDYLLPDTVYAYLEAQIARLLDRIFECVLGDSQFLAQPVTWNVNFPYTLAPDCELRVAPVSRKYYASLFERSGRGYRHNMNQEEIRYESAGDSDIDVLMAGHVSISRLDLREFGQLELDQKKELQALIAK